LDNLGVSFALMAGVERTSASAYAVGEADRAERDMTALTALCEARTHHDLPELRLQLENLIHRPENPYLVP